MWNRLAVSLRATLLCFFFCFFLLFFIDFGKKQEEETEEKAEESGPKGNGKPVPHAGEADVGKQILRCHQCCEDKCVTRLEWKEGAISYWLGSCIGVCSVTPPRSPKKLTGLFSGHAPQHVPKLHSSLANAYKISEEDQAKSREDDWKSTMANWDRLMSESFEEDDGCF
ncbi:hypothetical protein FN846DRAFT_896729 [Sphaerosporella brunnea]|uniref:Uncharacterized protein n=1 Tax=Sphaerosporella brunnea TaxID=1250544 RepID=A0A5J5ECU7_9PEZI|nr:hypothetical protein FN846DRAFT_896729 [Sphaerosporella brunnea]